MTISEKLKIRITDGGQEILELEFPAFTVDLLPTFMPAQMLDTAKASGTPIEAIVERAKSSNYAPQEIFSSEIGARKYLVWLE